MKRLKLDHEPLPMLPWWVERWRGSRARDVMNMEQQGVYRALLDAQWCEPDCALPDDDETLRALARATPEEWLRTRVTVLAWFDKNIDGRLMNISLRQEWRIARKKRVSIRKKGRKGGLKSGLTRRSRSKRSTKLSFGPASAQLEAGAKPPSPSPSPSQSPSTEKVNGSSAAVAAAPLAVLPGRSWSAEACDDWKRHLGTPPGGRIGAALKPLVKEHGWKTVRPVWQEACERAASEPEPEYFTPQVFARTFTARLQAPRALVPRGSYSRETVGDKTVAAMDRFIKRGGGS